MARCIGETHRESPCASSSKPRSTLQRIQPSIRHSHTTPMGMTLSKPAHHRGVGTHQCFPPSSQRTSLPSAAPSQQTLPQQQRRATLLRAPASSECAHLSQAPPTRPRHVRPDVGAYRASTETRRGSRRRSPGAPHRQH